MGRASNRPVKVRFSIGSKLVTLITFLLLISLGTITVLVSVLVSQYLRVTAEENNFEANQRLADEVENSLANLSSNSTVLMQIMKTVGEESELANQAADFFFERNPHVAALIFTVPDRDWYWVNDQFFHV